MTTNQCVPCTRPSKVLAHFYFYIAFYCVSCVLGHLMVHLFNVVLDQDNDVVPGQLCFPLIMLLLSLKMILHTLMIHKCSQ